MLCIVGVNVICSLINNSDRSRTSQKVGVPNPRAGEGAPTYCFGHFSRKLHQIENNWNREVASLVPPLDPPLNKMITKPQIQPIDKKSLSFLLRVVKYFTFYLFTLMHHFRSNFNASVLSVRLFLVSEKLRGK